MAKDKLFVLWTSGDPEVAKHMVFMYTKNAKLRGWWGTVRLIVWGPSANLLAHDEELQAELHELRQAGVEVQACKACADRYGVSDQLAGLGIEVIYMGVPMTEYIKAGWASLSVQAADADREVRVSREAIDSLAERFDGTAGAGLPLEEPADYAVRRPEFEQIPIRRATEDLAEPKAQAVRMGVG